MALTNIQINNTKPTDKLLKLSDGGGLYLLVHPNGSKYWRLKYRYLGKEKTYSIGIYPIVSLSEARERRELAKKDLANNIDPSDKKLTERHEAVKAAANTFEAVTREWHDKQKVKWVPKNAARNISMLERHIFPFIGSTSITQLRVQKEQGDKTPNQSSIFLERLLFFFKDIHG